MSKILVVAVLACLVFAPVAAADSLLPAKTQEFLSKAGSIIWNNALAITIVFIFLSALIGFFLKARAVNKCLKDFRDDMVTVEADATISGNLQLYSTGIELKFREAHEEDGLTGYSHIMYKGEYGGIQAVYRYQDALSPENAKSREKDIRRTYKPGMFRRMRRWLRNMLGTFRDAFVQSMGVVVGHMKKTKPGTAFKGQEKQIKDIGADIISSTGNTYDPILEKYIGRKVIVEISKGDEVESVCGIFKEYSPDFLEILNLQLPQQINFSGTGDELKQQSSVSFSPLKLVYAGKGIKIENTSHFPVYLKNIQAQDKKEEVAQLLEAGKACEVNFADAKKIDNFDLATVRQVDIIVPRSRAVLRHAADQYKMDWRSVLKFDL